MAHEITPKTRPNLYATTTEEKTMPYHTVKQRLKRRKLLRRKRKQQ